MKTSLVLFLGLMVHNMFSVPYSPQRITIELGNPLLMASKAHVFNSEQYYILGDRVDRVEYTKALGCLTEALIYESGYEPVKGIKYVANVVMNRVKSKKFPNTVCEVIHQKIRGRYQFSYLKFKMPEHSVEMYAKVYPIAVEALQGKISLMGWKFYKRCDVDSGFFNTLHYKFRVANHCFYGEV